MPAVQEPNSGLWYGWELTEDLWSDGMNSNLTRLGRFGFHLAVISSIRTDPPSTSSDGDAYIIASPATGVWAGQENNVAIYDGGGWFYAAPRSGWTAMRESDKATLYFDGAVWSKLPALLKDDPAPELSANMLSKGFRFIATNAVGDIKGMIAHTADDLGLAVAYSEDGTYDPNNGGFFCGIGLAEIHGQRCVIKSPDITFDQLGAIGLGSGIFTLKIDQDGNLYTVEDPAPLHEQNITSSSTQAVTTTETFVTELTITADAIYTAGDSRFYLFLEYENTNNRMGVFYAQVLVDGTPSAPVSNSISERSSGSLIVDIPLSVTVQVGQVVTIECWKIDDAQATDVALTGGHRLRLYQV